MRVLQLLILSALLFSAHQAFAVIYKYQDSRGNYHFTDRPLKGRGYRLIWQSGAYDSSRSRSRIDSASMERNRSRYTPLINKVADRVGLSRELLHAVVRVESLYDPKARSSAGALGLMQLMPETARRYGVQDRLNPGASLDGGARYLRDLLKLFKNNLKLAVAAYNAGENAVIKHGHQVPPFPETRQYVKKVLALYQQTDS